MSWYRDHTGKVSAARLNAAGWSLVLMARMVWISALGMALGMPDALITAVAIVSLPLVKWAESKQGPEILKALLAGFSTMQNAATNASDGSIDKVLKAIGHNVWPDNKKDDESGS